MHKLTLHFKTVTIENIGGYYGEHQVDFPSGERNMLMIRGNNTAGKTSLINGLKWCLFNQIDSSKEGTLDPFTLYNAKALRSGPDHPMRVTIEAMYDDAPIIIERRATWRFEKTTPQNYDQLDIGFTVTQENQDGSRRVLSQDESERMIGRIAPPILGRFFLFDGELLDEYRDLVSQSRPENRDLAQAINGVLGLPILAKAESVVDSAIKHAQKLTRSYAQGDQAELNTRKIEGLQEENNQFIKEVGESGDRLKDVNKELSALDRRLDHHTNDEIAFAERDALKKRADTLATNIQMHREELASMGANAWHDLAQPALSERREAVNREADAMAQTTQKEVKQDHLEELRRNVLAEGNCPVCYQSPDAATRQKLESLLGELEADRDARASRQYRYETLIGQRNALQQLLDKLTPVKPLYQSKVGQLSEALHEKFEVQRQLDELIKRSSNITQEELLELRRKRDGLLKEIGHLEAGIEKQKAEITKNEARIQTLQEKLERDAEQSEKANVVKQARKRLDAMKAVIEKAHERQTEAMRKKVEEYTSHAYVAMTHEAHHERVEIAKDTFRMTIIDDTGAPVLAPSAGATQILAFSLIISLGQIGRKIGPLVMDTPLGRLDVDHRLQVLEYLPHHSHQVAMLYHSGEINEEMYRHIAHKVGESYLIVKSEAENSSRLERAPLD
ncbi:MAG TPA: hypothetical protein DCQ42_08975 [Halomonas sp.]|jgi:DNA sulfur modification protein DndD|uniref:hypothetical protein n=1 Tax=Halomonadaceae TaxID=28256 RepID=UPI000C48F797|nr:MULTISPECIES: hypothetical protein [Halomonas]MBV66679.1 hypothetical protein [Halomonas sp.]MCD1652209.1 hypothetical protein [Halomonas axialensis]MCD2089197.1 hypothetical protein [Halomonas meridiana]MCO7244429.1 hypothetical protein [Halomonas sp. Ps84H-12]HAO01848.1 hypothetical protein [Halomonas sp.]|tara:strand:- start:4143 stop:6173 length:2031 start_codon:yes stop_codon:yes gene_type:complete